MPRKLAQLNENFELVGPIIGRMILFSDTTTVPSLGEQFTAVDSLTTPTQAQFRIGDGVTGGGLIASSSEIIVTTTQTITPVNDARYVVLGNGITVTFNDVVSPVAYTSRFAVRVVFGTAVIGTMNYSQVISGLESAGWILRSYSGSAWVTNFDITGFVGSNTDGANLGGSGAVGSRFIAGSISPLVYFSGGNGGSNSASGTGIGGEAKGVSSFQLARITWGNGGAANGNFNGGNGGSGANSSQPIRLIEISSGGGGAAGTGGNGGNGGSLSSSLSANPIIRIQSGGGGAGGAGGAGGNGGGCFLFSADYAIFFLGGTGGAGGTAGGVGGNGGRGGNSNPVTGVLEVTGGNGGAAGSTGNGGNGGDSTLTKLAFKGGNGGIGADANGGNGGLSGSITLNGGAGGNASGAVAGGAGGASGVINLSGAAASGTIAGLAGPSILSGTGTPEGVVTAPVSSLFLRMDGGAGTCMYVKESGTGNTGWAAK